MAVPQRRTSKTRKRTRRTHFKLTAKGIVRCPHCGEMIEPHKICPHCGYYNEKKIIGNNDDNKVTDAKNSKK